MIKLKDLLSEQDINNNVNIPALEFDLKDLTFDDVLKSFPGDYKNEIFSRTQLDGKKGPYYRDSVAFPKAGNGMHQVGDLSSFEDWKKEFLTKFGESIILLDPDAEWFDKVKVKNDKFDQQSDDSYKGIKKYYQDKLSGGFTGD